METGFRGDLLADKVAVVTGAARGIGRATAGLMSALGARVAVCDRRDDELPSVADDLRAGGGEVLAAPCDVRDTDAVAEFVDAVTLRFGHVDILVNNAGGSFNASFLDTSAKGEQMLIAENFTQVTDLIRRCVPLMPDGASIVNVTSVEVAQAAPGFGIYAAMKSALGSLTRTLALELAPRGIRVNAVAPDALVTDGEADSRAVMADDAGPYVPAFHPPIGCLGTASDGAAAIVFLCSPMASFVTGTTMHVDGGTWAAGGWHRRPAAT